MAYLTLTVIGTVLLILFKIKGRKFVYHPYFFICLYHIFFFKEKAHASSSQAFNAELAVVISFISFTFAFAITLKFFSSSFLKMFFSFFYSKFTVRVDLSRSGKLRGIWIYLPFLLILLWCLVYIKYTIWEYGSLESAMLHFYVGQKKISDPVLGFFIYRGINMCFALLLFLRLQTLLYYKHNIVRYLPFIAYLVLSLTIAPVGNRGPQLYLLIIFIFSDIVIAYSSKRRLKLSLGTKFALAFTMLMVGILTKVRNENFHSFRDFSYYISNNLFDQVGEGLSDVSRGGSIPDDIVSCFRIYSHEKLGWHSLYSIIVNPIPRVFWPEKPLSFGTLLALEKGASLNARYSIAAGMAGEGYAAGGFFGIIILSLLVGVYSGVMGKIYIISMYYMNYINILIAVAALRASCHIVRGDMMAGVTQGLYPFILLCFLIKMLTFLGKRKTI